MPSVTGSDIVFISLIAFLGTLTLHTTASLTRRDRNDRRALLLSRVREREEKHDKRKQSLRGEVFVVDPIPVLPIRHGGKGIVGFARRVENADQSRHGRSVHYLWRRRGECPRLLHVVSRNINVGGKVYQDFKHGTGKQSDLFVMTGNRAVDHAELIGVRIETQEFAYLVALGIYRWVWLPTEHD